MQGASQTRLLWDGTHRVWFIGLSGAIFGFRTVSVPAQCLGCSERAPRRRGRRRRGGGGGDFCWITKLTALEGLSDCLPRQHAECSSTLCWSRHCSSSSRRYLQAAWSSVMLLRCLHGRTGVGGLLQSHHKYKAGSQMYSTAMRFI